MSFAHPVAFALGLLAIPLVLLYRRKTPFPQRFVATDWLWEKALAEERFRAAWLKYREGASLGLHLFVLALVALAAAGPQYPAPRHVAIVIDNGRTMNAVHVAGTRLDAAKEAAREIVASLDEFDEAVIFSGAGQPSQRAGPTNDRAVLLKAIDGISICNEGSALALAYKAVDRLSTAHNARFQFVAVTDGCSSEARACLAQKRAEWLWEIVRGEAGHVALTRFAARRSISDPSMCDLFVELENFGDADARGNLNIMLDGKTQASVALAIAKNGRFDKVLNVRAPIDGRLTAQFDPANPVSTGVDDSQATLVAPFADQVVYAPLTSSGVENGGLDLRTPAAAVSNLPLEFKTPPPLPVWMYPAALALVLMVAEWCLYQRRWMC